MASNNEGVVVYQTWFENAAKLGEEKQTRAIMQIIRYGLYGEVPDNSKDLYLDLLLSDWMPLVDAAKSRRKGGAPKGNKNAAGNKGGGRPKKTQLENTTFNTNTNTNTNTNEYTYINLPSVDTPASGEVAGDTTSGEEDCDYAELLRQCREVQ